MIYCISGTSVRSKLYLCFNNSAIFVKNWTDKMYSSSLVTLSGVFTKAVIMLLVFHCLLMLPLYVLFVPCFVMFISNQLAEKKK